MRAEILSCGTELLLGHISDTNATFLAQSLTALGIDLYYVSQVGDNQGRIVETLRRAWERSDFIIMTGGLGPTEDDLTRESISALLGESMTVDPKLEAELRHSFTSRNVLMPERNLKQATLIPSAQSLPNPRGSAPGWFVEKDGHMIVAMPGVPHEMYRMWEEEAVPRLARYTGGAMFTRILRVTGMGESSIEEKIEALLHGSNPTVATYAKSDGVDVRVTAKAESREVAEQMVAAMEVQIRQLLGQHIFGVDKDTLGSVVGEILRTRGLTVSVLESLTGGLLAHTFTNNPGSSQYFVGGVVAYTNQIKMRSGVPASIIEEFGAVSAETARAMARAARQFFQSDYSIGITGVAGPDLQENKPAGTIYIAIDGPQGIIDGRGPGWRGGREEQKRVAALTALNLLRLHLQGLA